MRLVPRQFRQPLDLDDSYGLASVFSDKPVEMVRCEIPTGKTATARFFYPELGEINPKAPLNERLQRLAELLTKPENGQFTRTIVNRLWGRFMGRGIIEPVDEMENEPGMATCWTGLPRIWRRTATISRKQSNEF